MKILTVMKRLPRKGRRGFSLVEVVISMAVVALALLAIVSLLAVFQKGTSTVVEREEAMSVIPGLNAYLQSQGFDTVFGWVEQSTGAPNMYAFIAATSTTSGANTITSVGMRPQGVPQMEIFPSTTANLATTATYRLSRLYFISITLSKNVTLHKGVNRTLVLPGSPVTTWLASSPPAYPSSPSDSAFFVDAMLPLSVRIYSVPACNPSTDTPASLEQKYNFPIVTYDTSISR